MVDPSAIRELMQKSDVMALRDTSIWFGAMLVLASIAVALWPLVVLRAILVGLRRTLWICGSFQMA